MNPMKIFAGWTRLYCPEQLSTFVVSNFENVLDDYYSSFPSFLVMERSRNQTLKKKNRKDAYTVLSVILENTSSSPWFVFAEV